jgi:hypothetical protein
MSSEFYQTWQNNVNIFHKRYRQDFAQYTFSQFPRPTDKFVLPLVEEYNELLKVIYDRDLFQQEGQIKPVIRPRWIPNWFPITREMLEDEISDQLLAPLELYQKFFEIYERLTGNLLDHLWKLCDLRRCTDHPAKMIPFSRQLVTTIVRLIIAMRKDYRRISIYDLEMFSKEILTEGFLFTEDHRVKLNELVDPGSRSRLPSTEKIFRSYCAYTYNLYDNHKLRPRRNEVWYLTPFDKSIPDDQITEINPGFLHSLFTGQLDMPVIGKRG